MFNIAMDEAGKTCNAHEIVAGKSVAAVGHAKKCKYYCVACVDGKHRVFLNIRHEIQDLDAKTRKYTSPAWFSHHGGGGNAGHESGTPSLETATHWQAKHILSEHVTRYCFETSKCTGCDKHTTLESGVGATGRVERSETTSDGKIFRFDAVLMLGEAIDSPIRSVLEVWATHETSDIKREYCLQKGYTFAEFHAQHVLEAHNSAPDGSVYRLENLKIRLFECPDCVHQRTQIALAQENTRLAAIAAMEAATIQTNCVVSAQGDTKKTPVLSRGVVSGVCKPNTLPYDPVTHVARLQVHLDEYSKCIVWCLKAGPEYHPAFDHKHKAPCNVENFYFGQTPWLSDGSVNPSGVPPAPFNYPTYQ